MNEDDKKKELKKNEHDKQKNGKDKRGKLKNEGFKKKQGNNGKKPKEFEDHKLNEIKKNEHGKKRKMARRLKTTRIHGLRKTNTTEEEWAIQDGKAEEQRWLNENEDNRKSGRRMKPTRRKS